MCNNGLSNYSNVTYVLLLTFMIEVIAHCRDIYVDCATV